MQPTAVTPPVSRLEYLFAAAALLLSTAAVLPLLAASSVTPVDPVGNPAVQKGWLAVYLVFAVLILRNIEHPIDLVRGQKLAYALTALAIASTAWSAAPAVTLRRGVALLLTTIVAVYLAERFSIDEFLDVAAWTLAAAVCLSVLFALAFPNYGIDPAHPGAWRGVFTTKNELGRLGSIAVLFWMLRLLSRSGLRVVALLVVGAALAATWLSQSRTSLVVVGVIVVVLLALPVLRAEPYVAAAGVMFICAALIGTAAWLQGHSGAAVGALGADVTFTGRTKIWAAVWQSIQVHPIRGYGYGSFWLGHLSPAQAVWSRLGQTPPHAHNGILDTWLQLGALGVGVILMWLGRALQQSWALMRSGGIAGSWPLLFLVMLIFTNITESSLLGRNSFIWIVAVAAATHAARSRETSQVAVERIPAGQVFPNAL